MKPGSPQVVADLQSGAAILAHLAGQFKADRINLKVMGLKWLAKRSTKWHHMAGDQLCLVVKRLFQFGENPSYEAGTVTGADTVAEILERAVSLTTDAHDQFCVFRKNAYDAKTDYTSDIHEHAIQALEHILTHAERELALIKKTRDPIEGSYVGARLEDGD